jgi:hypothetical protein
VVQSQPLGPQPSTLLLLLLLYLKPAWQLQHPSLTHPQLQQQLLLLLVVVVVVTGVTNTVDTTWGTKHTAIRGWPALLLLLLLVRLQQP